MDLNLRIGGDPSGAVEALGDVGDAANDLEEQQKKLDKASSEAWASVAKGAAVAGAAVVAFGVSSVKAFADAERVQKQLERAAGSYAGQLDKQSQALSRLYAIDDDIIKQSMVLYTQWGGVAAATNEAEKAALNLSVAMGGDLKAATEDIIRNVESGGTGLAKMGIHFKVTGDKAKDFEAAVAAINAKLGGAAAADAGTLTGQLHAAALAFEDIQKSIGGSISKFIQQTGVVGKLTGAMRDLNGLFTPSIEKREEDPAGMIEFWEQVASGNATAWKDQAAGIQFTFEEAQDQLAQWRAKLNPSNFNAAFEGGPHITGKTNKEMKGSDEATAKAESHAVKMAALAEKNLESMRKEQKDIDTLDAAAMAKDQAEYAEELAMSAKRVGLAVKEGEDVIAALQLSVAKENKLREEQVKYRDKAAARMLKETNDSNREAMQSQAREAASAANAIGAAFVNALSDQLAKLAEGGELDVAVFIGDIIAAAIGVASVALSAAFPQFAGLIQAAGGLATVGVRAGAKGISADNQRRRAAGAASGGSYSYHSGGWVGDEIDIPRHHSGAWIGADEQRAILQTGERVLSRKEVHHIGGAGAVDNMAKGGGGPRVVVQIHAIDSKGAAESIENDFGKGMRRALRSGRGDFPALMGGSPR